MKNVEEFKQAHCRFIHANALNQPKLHFNTVDPTLNINSNNYNCSSILTAAFLICRRATSIGLLPKSFILLIEALPFIRTAMTSVEFMFCCMTLFIHIMSLLQEQSMTSILFKRAVFISAV